MVTDDEGRKNDPGPRHHVTSKRLDLSIPGYLPGGEDVADLGPGIIPIIQDNRKPDW
jgi:hypothetical protein